MKMKKTLALLVCALLLVVSVLPGAALAQEKKIQIVTTIFPIYDWVREIVGKDNDQVELTMLLDSGVDLHSFQPTVQDILKISTCDLFAFVGGESDAWVHDALNQAENRNMAVLNLVELMGDNIKAEEIVEGMEHDHEDDHDDEDDHDHDHEEEEEADEHVWLSLRNARILCRAIADRLCEIDPDSAEKYQKNLDEYTAKLTALDQEYAQAVESAAYKTVLFGDRFPFRYLVDDYGLDYYAAFSGCSAEAEASFQTVVFLAQKVDELNLPTVLTIEGDNHRVAQTIVETTRDKNQKVLTLDSMQGVTAANVAAGVSYLEIMQNNLAVLTEALN